MTEPKELTKATDGSVINSMVGALIGCIIAIKVSSLIDALLHEDYPSTNKKGSLWITSPSGKTVKKLPFYLALRIVRKQKWNLAKVEPIRQINRLQALKILVRGDN